MIVRFIIWFILGSIINPSVVFGQNDAWFEIGKTWYYRSGNVFNGFSDYARMTITKDTVIQSKHAFIFDTYGFTNGSIDSTLISRNYAYAQGNQVYYFRAGQEWIKFIDFDWVIGDTIAVIAPLEREYGEYYNLCNNNTDDYIYARVIGRDSVLIRDRHYPRLIFDPLDLGCKRYSINYHEITWGVGKTDFFFLYDDLACDQYCMPWLRCVENGSFSFNFGKTQCDEFQLGTSTNEVVFSKERAVFPNPIKGGQLLTILSNQEVDDGETIYIYDRFSRLIAKRILKNRQITIPNLESGIYIIVHSKIGFESIPYKVLVQN